MYFNCYGPDGEPIYTPWEPAPAFANVPFTKIEVVTDVPPELVGSIGANIQVE